MLLNYEEHHPTRPRFGEEGQGEGLSEPIFPHPNPLPEGEAP
jgi:hypothetical protein